MLIGKLNVVVAPSFVRSEGPNGKKKPVTNVQVRLGETVIATRTLGGTYNSTQALTEFKRFPERFTPQEGVPVSTLKALAA